MKLELDPVEEKQAKKYRAQHTKACPKISPRLRGDMELNEECTPVSSFSYVFTPTGVGPVIKIRCECCDWHSPQIFNPDVEL